MFRFSTTSGSLRRSSSRRVGFTIVWLLALTGLVGLAVHGASAGDLRPNATSTSEATAFVGLAPVRLLDTRIPIGASTARPLGPGETITLPVAGQNGVPSTAVSVLLNLTVDATATAKSFLTVWAAGDPRPNTSANNAEPGRISPNTVLTALGHDGAISIFNERGSVDIVVDIVGYFVSLADTDLGSRLLTGTGSPASSLGGEGDVYLDSSTATLFGPKSNLGWGNGTRLGAVNAALSATNDAGIATPTLTSGSLVPFNTPGVTVGNGISQVDVDTFAVADTGVYRITYRVTTALLSLLGGVRVLVDGTPASPTTTLAAAGSQLSDTTLINADANQTIEVQVEGTGLTLGSGVSASITIERIA